MVKSELPYDIRDSYIEAKALVYVGTEEDEIAYKAALHAALVSRGYRKVEGICTCRYRDCREFPRDREPHCGYVKAAEISRTSRTNRPRRKNLKVAALCH